jgi:hypothetical protein
LPHPANLRASQCAGHCSTLTTYASAAVVVEADFPDAFRLNMYVRGLGSDKTAQEALGDFKRFPTW